MTPERRRRFAWLITHFCQQAQEGDRVILEYSPAVQEVAGAVERELTEAGTQVLVAPAGFREERVPIWESATGYVMLRTQEPLRSSGGLAEADAEKIRGYRMTKRKTTTYLPDEILARRAGVSLSELEERYARWLHLDDEAPIRAFEELRERQERLVERLEQAREITITGSGTELTVSTVGRTWVNSYGRRNFPSGEVYTSPVENSANGVITFDVPSYREGGRVAAVTLVFCNGLVVEASAGEGEEILQRLLGSDAGASSLGEIGIGGNRAITTFTGATLFDEKVYGTVHLALGRSYPQTGGRNVSSLHWDLVKDLRGGGAIHADGESIYAAGQ